MTEERHHSKATLKLTHRGVLAALNAAADAAEEIGVPQCVVLVDATGTTLASLRMDGAKFLSLRTASRKAITAASARSATGDMDGIKSLRLAVATDGDFISLEGGLPIFIGGHLVGAIGVGSGTGAEDLTVARAAIAAIDAAAETP
ncbi:heme-binding protein [Ensifer sp. YR511]|uniref:GlcG/HbpS family heme-binding protein n=1 Tax=Ensifer sp. YR511 TaxID=1855294 RepID=UPI000884D1A5|nr:heme-binding protein [Ensifer sp. YR511]SDO07626.1 Uncharacterized conserved protein GlcG, DUF336 family [Ensifer sp. YR511]